MPVHLTRSILRITPDPWFGNFSNVVFDDQYFKFVFEDMIVKGATFDVNLAQITDHDPEVVSDEIRENESDQEQSLSFTFSSSVTNTSSFESGSGFMIGVSTEFKGACFIQFKVYISSGAYRPHPSTFSRNSFPC